jgi:hypothetical protein
MRRIVDVLDPEGDGKIHFGEFCQAVKQTLELKSKYYSVCGLDVVKPEYRNGDVFQS